MASIYWYVASKDELLDRATDHVLGGVLDRRRGAAGSDDPIDDLRAMAVTLFDAIVDRPWLGAYFMRNTDVQANALRLYEKLGQQMLRLDLTAAPALPRRLGGRGLRRRHGGRHGPGAARRRSSTAAVDRDEYLGRYAATSGGRSTPTSSPSCTTSSTSSPGTTTASSSAPGST